MIQLGMFAKYWAAGEVKTRLAADVGAERAARLARAFLEYLLARFGDFGDGRVVKFTPTSRAGAFSDLVSPGWRFGPQGDGDLGQRMRAFFAEFKLEAGQQPGDDADSIGRGDGRILLIGSDAPTLPRATIEQAGEELRHAPVVLGPSDDGGYYLIGLQAKAIDEVLLSLLFDDLPWSDPRLLRLTTKRLARHRIPFATLPVWYDVDDVDDLARLAAELADAPADDRPLAALRQVVESCFND